ncbi:tRNA-dihydrouridine(47) synthase [NAD(P)(+)]-like protein [Mortierella alpina]|uniref:tRNA-dihydrouridine(47) synthase [NAD(P)(+)] n=1 Tax=Mortierella alpina TaxID=64518 RepID=A0A9P6JBU9_MORAP|nr:tRNA-dihydrouridine(47) synthase [NAD(P)(+)]-like protein [Mortierella alpina]
MAENQAVPAAEAAAPTATIAAPSETKETATPTYHKGIAPIKAQYLVPKAEVKKEETLAHLSEAVEAQGDEGRTGDDNHGGNDANDANDSNKRDRKDKHVKNKRKKRGGQNQDRVVTRRIEDEVQLCFKVAKGAECENGESCKFTHDIKKYLEAKDKDIGDRCVNFEKFGECHYGYKCRYLGAHMDADGRLIKDEEKMAKVGSETMNVFPHQLTIDLRSYKFDFSRSEAYLKKMADEQAEAAEARKMEEQAKKDKAMGNGASEQSPAQDVSMENQDVTMENVAEESSTAETSVAKDEKDLSELENRDVKKPRAATVQEEVTHSDTPDVRLRPCEKKKIDFRGKTYLAPLTTVGNLPFRRICKEYGVDITCGEMAMAANLVQGQKAELALLRRHKSEDIFGVQLTGNKVDVVVRACDMINQQATVDFVDLNMGCPIDLVFNAVRLWKGLLQSQGKMKRMITGMKSVLDVPVTVKFRMAIYDKKPIGTNLTNIYHGLGAALGTLHGRSRQQRYTKLADWDYISQCAAQDRGIPGTDSYMPLFGNGDILGSSDYYSHLDQHKVDGCMIGRGALMKPWIFEEIKTNRDWDISSGERFDMLKRFCDYGLEHWGSDTQGVNQTRRFLLEWQSFLHRYVPAGLLEVLPQKINDRPPAFVGRNDLETLMASPSVTDWIKISDMILGPAPEAFRFDPKHKANSTTVEG